jgi:hypothetical protein
MYKKTVKLQDNETLAKINKETGEILEVGNRRNNIPKGKELFQSKAAFTKTYDEAWDYLLENLKPTELKIVVQMCRMTRMNSNSLEPLNDSSTAIDIAETFGVHRNHVKRIFDKLFKLGIYAEFKFHSVTGLKHYWVLNPYISFRGKVIDSGIVDLFRESKIAHYINSER